MRAHVHYSEALPAIVSIIALSGFVLPKLTVMIAYATILLKLVAFVTALAMNEGYQNCSATRTKIVMYLASDLPVYIFGAYSIFEMIRLYTEEQKSSQM